MDKPLVNRVANSALKVINLEDFYPTEDVLAFDIKDYLFRELLLKEKDFRTSLKEHDWTQYQDKTLLVYCSSDAIVPMWAYMLIASYATPYAANLFQGNKEAYTQVIFSERLRTANWSAYEGQMVCIKGCGDKAVPAAAYMELTQLLQPIAKRIMYGEPCSTVPIYKKMK